MKETKADDTTRLNLRVHDRSLLSCYFFFKGSSPCVYSMFLRCFPEAKVGVVSDDEWFTIVMERAMRGIFIFS